MACWDAVAFPQELQGEGAMKFKIDRVIQINPLFIPLCTRIGTSLVQSVWINIVTNNGGESSFNPLLSFSQLNF